MKKVLVTFGGAAYDSITEQVVRDAPGFGVDEFWVYDDTWIEKHPFRKLNTWLWDHRSPLAAPGRGLCWYAFKPLILFDAMSKLVPGDVVAYIDADTKPIADISVLFDTAARDGAMLFRASAHMNYRWCTQDAVTVMGLDPALLTRKRYPGPTPDFLQAPAGCARFMSFAVGRWKPFQLLAEWLAFSINPMSTTFEPSMLGADHPDFEESRSEQQILTLLGLKYGYPLHREADQYGNEYIGQPEQPGSYPQLFEQRHLGGPHPLGRGSRFRNVPLPDQSVL